MVLTLTASLGGRPVVVLAAGETMTMSGGSEEGNAAMRRTWLELHGELARLSTNSDHRIVEGAVHYVDWERPEAVIAMTETLSMRRAAPTEAPPLSDGAYAAKRYWRCPEKWLESWRDQLTFRPSAC